MGDDDSDEQNCTLLRCNLYRNYLIQRLETEQPMSFFEDHHIRHALEPEWSVCTGIDGKGKCLQQYHMCNGYQDCEDGSDEANCVNQQEDRPCPNHGAWPCDDGSECVDSWYVCDGSIQCADGSDEKDCTQEKCGKDKFACADGSRCIYNYEVCDGNPYSWGTVCPDGSDEENCAEKCKAMHKFACEDGQKCLSNWYVCNGQKDCDDGSDEGNCTDEKCYNHEHEYLMEQQRELNGDSYDTFDDHGYEHRKACADGSMCYDSYMRCDGTKSCADGTDEQGCTQEVCDPRGDGHMSCADQSRCVKNWEICDGNPNCADGSDETEESCAAYCNQNRLMCDDMSKCINRYNICDGRTDCADGSDEGDCDAAKCQLKFGVFEDRWMGIFAEDVTSCKDNTRCIQKRQVCDGWTDWECGQDTEQNCGEAPFPEFPVPEMQPYPAGGILVEPAVLEPAVEPPVPEPAVEPPVLEPAVEPPAVEVPEKEYDVNMDDEEWRVTLENDSQADLTRLLHQMITYMMETWPEWDDEVMPFVPTMV